MAELDHIVFATPDLAQGSKLIQDLTGAEPEVGGPHIGRGTCNTLLTFDDRTYFEIIGPDPGQPEPERARGFGIDQLTAPKLVAFAIHPIGDETLADLATIVRDHGFDPGQWMAMSRQKPDGELLEWELTAGGDTGFRLDGAIPFAIDWLGAPSPAASLPSMGQLNTLTVQHPNEQVGACLTALGLAGAVTYVPGPASLTLTVDTPTRTITL